MISKNKLFVLILLAVLFVFSLEFVSSSPLSVPGYEFLSENAKKVDVRNWVTYIYSEDDSDKQFNVQIIEYDTKADLDFHLKNKENIGDLEVNNEIIFIGENNNYVFWVNENRLLIVKIVNMGLFDGLRDGSIDADSIGDYIDSPGSDDFPIPLIKAYLEKYTSECTKGGCVSEESLLKEKIKEDLKWFWNPPADIKDSSYYDIYTEADIVPRDIINCMNELDNYLKLNSINTDDKDMTLDECAQRKRFLEVHENYNPGSLELLFDERNKIILHDIEFQQEREEEHKNSEIYRKVQKKIKENTEERQQKRDERASDNSPNEISGQIVDSGANQESNTPAEEIPKEQHIESNDEKKDTYTPLSKRIWDIILSLFIR